MPRKGRGGERQGTPGTAYSNRSDLNQPISTVPNQEYGMAKQQADAQRAIPMGASPVASVPVPSPAQSAGNPLPRPGDLPHTGPTNRPDEPVTAGIDYGPGPGSETFSSARPPVMEQIKSAARYSSSPALSELAVLASTMGM